MAPETGQSDLIALLIYPDQKKIILHMTLHKAGIIPFKHMWIKFIRNTAGFLQQGQYSHQALDFLRFVLVPFQVLLELACIFENPHDYVSIGMLQIP